MSCTISFKFHVNKFYKRIHIIYIHIYFTTISTHFFTQLSLSIVSTCPNHLTLHLRCGSTSPYLTLPLYAVSYAYQPQANSFVSRLSIIQCHITCLLYHCVISLQLCQVLLFHYLALPIIENNTPDTCLEIFPSVSRENTLDVSKGKGSLNFFQPHLILATILSSMPSAAIIVSPKWQNLFTASKDSLLTQLKILLV